MSDIPSISVHITLKPSNDHALELSPPAPDDQMQCELWVTCENPQCFKSGCANVLAKQSKEVKS